MKKILAFILCLVSVFGLLACTPQETLLSIDTSCWNADNATYENLYEKSVYTVTKKNGAGTVVAEGLLTYTLGFDHKNTETGNVYSYLTSDFTITYNDNANEVDRGKTDTITSKCVFHSSVLLPVMSEKTVTLADREGVTNDSYFLSTDYIGKLSTLEWTKNGREKSTLAFKGQQSEVYDNEMLYYLVRAVSDIKPGASTTTVNISNLFESHLNGKYNTYSFNCTSSAKDADEALHFATLSSYLDGSGALSAMKATLSLNKSKETGPSIALKLSTTPFKLSDTVTNERVILTISTTEYDILKAEKAFTTEYSLTEYSVTP